MSQSQCKVSILPERQNYAYLCPKLSFSLKLPTDMQKTTTTTTKKRNLGNYLQDIPKDQNQIIKFTLQLMFFKKKKEKKNLH